MSQATAKLRVTVLVLANASTYCCNLHQSRYCLMTDEEVLKPKSADLAHMIFCISCQMCGCIARPTVSRQLKLINLIMPGAIFCGS